MIKILLVEDDKLLGESLCEFFLKNGYEAKWIDDDRDVMATLSIELFDIVILDLMLKFSKGEDLVKKIKEKNRDLPIIVTTAKNDIKSKEECFSYGADDYLTKPFNPKELILRIDAVCKRFYPVNQIEKIGDLEIDMDSKTVKKGAKELFLTKKEWALLEFLIKRKGKVVTHGDILNYIWADRDVGEDSVRAYIKKLRNILPEGAIETCKGRGYRLK